MRTDNESRQNRGTSCSERHVTNRDPYQGRQNYSEVKQVQEFVYIGGTICSDATCHKDISQKIGIASRVARSLEKIWKAKDINKETKVLIYRTLVQSILLYNELLRRRIYGHYVSLRCQW